ncbi:hypothetical protein Tco_0688991 [Tanacetum coccineum]
MAKLAFCDYHNMVAILEKTESNTDFHQIVDFLEASHIRYALTVHPTVYVSHIQQFWSTARVETVDGETKIIAKVNGRQRTVTESSIRRHLKLLDDEGISTLPDNELFENLSLMGYNISPNQRFSFQKGQFSHQWKFLIHTIMQCLSPKSTGFNEFSSNIATAIVCLATNRVYNFSKMIFDGMVRNIKSKVKFLMFPRFIEKNLKMGQFGVIKHTETYDVPFHTQKVFTTLRVNSPSFFGRTVQLFESMLVPQGEGSENPTEPHHTPSAQYESTPQEDQTTSPEPIPQATTLPSQSHPDISTPRRLTRGAIRISQSKAPTPGADETASPTRDDRHGEAFPTATSLDAGQDRENIAKTSAMPHEASPRVTSLDGWSVRGRSQYLEITQLKNIVKTLEDNEKSRVGFAKKDALNTGRGDRSRGGFVRWGHWEVLRPVVTMMSISCHASIVVSPVVATASGSFPTTAIFTTASVATPRVSRSPKGIVIESSPPISVNIPSISKEDKGKGLKKDSEQKPKTAQEQAERDSEIAMIHAERELEMMIAELDRSNEMVAKYLSEYEQAEAELSHDEKVELINELLEYQRNLAQIKKYQAQQSKLATKAERRKFYMSVLRSNGGWKVKDFKGMTFEQIEEKFIPVWEKIQNFVPMNSKLESERLKRPGIQLDKERVKKLKTAEVSGTKPSQEQQSEDPKELSEEESKSPIVEKKDSDDHDKIINLQQWAVLVREEVSVEVTPFAVKSPICDWKIFKDRLRDVMFELVASDGLWQYQAPIKDWKLYSSCRVHCLSMEGMVIYMLDNVEYPLPKSTLQRMLESSNVCRDNLCIFGALSEHVVDEELDRMLEGVKNVDIDAFMNDVLNSQEDPDIRIEPRSDKKSPEAKKDADMVTTTNDDVEEESAGDEFELKMKENGNDAPSSANKEKLKELMVTNPSPSSSTPKPRTFQVIQEFHSVDGWSLWSTRLLRQLFQYMLLKDYYWTKKTQADVAVMIVEAIQKERDNLHAEVISQVNDDIANHIPPQVDSFLQDYMSNNILHVHPTQPARFSAHDLQHQLFLMMKDDKHLCNSDLPLSHNI